MKITKLTAGIVVNSNKDELRNAISSAKEEGATQVVFVVSNDITEDFCYLLDGIYSFSIKNVEEYLTGSIDSGDIGDVISNIHAVSNVVFM